MATTIKLKNGSGAPTALAKSEPAFDLTNNRLYTSSNTSNSIVEIGTNPSSLSIAGASVTSTAAELNLLDGSSAGTVVNSKAVIYSGAGQVKGTTVALGNWVLEEISNHLVFKYNGNTVFKVMTTGAIVAEGDITAFGTA